MFTDEYDEIEGVLDISNADRLGISKVDLVQILVDGVKLLIEMEKALSVGEDIGPLIPTEQVMRVNSHTLYPRGHVTDDDSTLKHRVSYIGSAQSMDELLPHDQSTLSIQEEEVEL